MREIRPIYLKFRIPITVKELMCTYLNISTAITITTPITAPTQTAIAITPVSGTGPEF